MTNNVQCTFYNTCTCIVEGTLFVIRKYNYSIGPFIHKFFQLKMQTFLYKCMFCLHENGENVHKNARKHFHFENAIQSGNFQKCNNRNVT